MVAPREIRTSRLLLRAPAEGDAEAVFDAYAQDPEVVRFLTWGAHTNVAQTQAFMDYCVGEWRNGTSFPWVITDGESGRLLGMIHLHPEGPRATIGYVVARPEWGRGIATEAVSAVADWALAQTQFHRVWALVDVENRASIRVLEKAGMSREGVLHRWEVLPNISETARDCVAFARWRDV